MISIEFPTRCTVRVVLGDKYPSSLFCMRNGGMGGEWESLEERMVNVRRRELHLDYFTHTHTLTHTFVYVVYISCTIRILVGNIKKIQYYYYKII